MNESRYNLNIICQIEDNIKMDLKKMGWGVSTGLIWFRTGTGGVLL
jgi:hypothetical protein